MNPRGEVTASTGRGILRGGGVTGLMDERSERQGHRFYCGRGQRGGGGI